MLQLFKKNYYLFLLLLLGIGSTSDLFSQNLITNGNFGTFNASLPKPPAVGYQSNYNQINYNQGNSIPREYAITNDAFSVNTTNFITLKDHTTGNGTGNMMVVDGDSNEIFWKQNPDRQLLAGQAYVFSFWIANVAISGNPKATIFINPNGCSGCPTKTVDLNTLPAGWNKVNFTIIPSTTQWVRIELSTVGAGGGGNDFAIDDISLFGPPLPIAISSSKTNPSCIAASDGAIIAYGAGGIQPYTYQLSGTATATNTTGIFTGLTAGTYTATVIDSDSTPKTVSTSLITLTEPTPVTISSSSTGCILSGNSVNLTATGGIAPYTWTANIGGNPSSTSNMITVNPTTTTTYNVSSTINSTLTPSNLITNGDFENFNNGFSSEYGFYTVNPLGAQIAYGIKSDPSQWYSKFGKYTDHTSGTGNMLVCDGATDGTSVVWSQTVTVNPSTAYNFSFWAQNLINSNYATFKVTVNDIPITISPTSATNIGAASDGSTVGGGWTELKGIWNSGGVSLATIKIIDTNTLSAGNDFAIDDIALIAQTPINKSCLLSASITLTVGGTSPITSFSYTTPICQNEANPLPILATGFKTGGNFSSTSGLAINSTTGEIDLANSTAGTYVVTYAVNADATLCTTAGSSTYTIVIKPVPTITSTQNNSRCGNGTLLLQAIASSGSVQWYTNATGGSAIATGSTFTTPSLSTTTTYYVDAVDNGCSTNSRTAVVATVNSLPAIPTFTKTEPTCSTPSGTLVITGPTPLTDYQFSLDGGTFTSATTYSNLIPGPHTLEAKLITTSCNSGTVTANIAPIPSGPTAIASTIAPATCGSSNGSISLGAVTGGTSGFTYSFDGSIFTATLNYSGLASGDHTLVIKDSNDCLSPVIVLNVPTISTPAQPNAVASAHPTCTNANAGEITVSTVAGLTYSIDGSDYSNTSGIFSGLTSGSYSVTAKNATGCISPATIVGINNQPITPVLVITNPNPVCSPTTIDLTAASITAGSTGGGTLSYWTNASATTPLLTPNSLTSSGTYYIKSIVGGICYDIKPVIVTIRPTETITIACGTNTMNSVSFNWNAITDCTGFTYTTTVNGAAGSSGTLIATATSLTISGLSPGDAVQLTLTPTGSNCVQAVTSAPCFTLVCPLPTVDAISNTVVCSGDTIPIQSFTSTPIDPTTTFNWTITNNIGNASATGTGNIPSFVANNTTNSPIVGTITVTASQGACTGPATTYTITVQPQPVVTITTPAAVCAPTTVDITTAFTATGGGTISYWRDAVASIPLTNPNAIAASGTYYIKSTVGTSTTCTDIKPVIVTIRPTEVITIACGTATLNSVTFNWNSISDATGFSYASTINGIAGPSGTLAAIATTLTIPGLLPNDAVQLKLTPTGSNCVQPVTSGICNALSCNNPVVTPMANLVVCSGASIPQQIFSSTPIDLINTKYHWSITNSIGASALSGIGNIPSFTALNNTNSAITATIQVYAEQLGPCIGPIMTYTITVQPQPIITVTNPAAVCAPATVDITTAFTATGGGTISYWNDAAASIPLTNPNAVAASGTYYIKSTVGSSTTCTDIKPVIVTIRPTEVITIACGTATLNSVTFNWNSISDATGFSYASTINGLAGPSGTLAATATTLTIPGLLPNDAVQLTLTPTGSNCVQPATSGICNALPCNNPVVSPMANLIVCSGASIPQQIFNSTPIDLINTKYHWSMTNSIGASALSGIGNIPSFTALNNTNSAITATIQVYAEQLGPCTGPIMTYTITVQPQPVVTVTNPAAVCAPATVDITKAFTATGGGTITYWTDAAASIPLTDPNAIAASGTYYIKSTVGSNTICTDIKPVNVTINTQPLANQPNALTICDDNNDGFGIFDLSNTTLLNEINSSTGVTISFHETQQNAINNVFAYTGLYNNNVKDNQTLYVRVSSNSTNCYALTTLQLKVNAKPLATLLAKPYELCDDNQDGFMTFNLRSLDSQILGVNNASTHTVSYFKNSTDAINNTNAISNASNYTNTIPNSETVFARVTQNTLGCFDVTSFTINVIALPTAILPTEYMLCDDASGNEIELFDLTTKINEITGGNTSLKVQFFRLQSEAIANANPITNITSFANTINSQTLFVSVTNTTTNCTSYTTLTLRVMPLPKPNTTPTTLQLCDNSTNNLGTATFDLTLAENEMKNGDMSLVLEYYTNKIDAEGGNTSNRIGNPSQFTNTTVNQNIYVRVSTSPANPNDIKCATVVTLPLKVNLLPGFNNVSNYVLCEPNTDGFMTFDFSNKTVEMLNTVSNPNDYKISYFDSQVNAINNTNPLSNLYTNTTAFSQNIYVRIDNLITNCSSTSNSLQLIVEEGAATTSVTNAQSSFCDTDDTNDGKMTLNLTAFNTILLGTNPVSNYQITYFTSLNDAQLNNNPIPNPSSYLSAIPFSYMVYARITNIVSASKCTAIEAITITINPQVLPKPVDGIICVDPISGATIRDYIIDSTLPTTGYTYQWSFNGTVLPLEQNATLVANKAGSYSLIATNTLTGCSSKEVKIEVKSSQSANASYILTRSFSKEQMFTVSVSNGTIEDYSYQLDQGEIQLSPIFNGVTPGPHQITIRDLDGCQETILDAYALDFPNFFTPNGDGYNDTWNISDLSNQPNAVIYIFDRFGKLLNEIRPQGNGWDGTYNRNDLPATDYWFKVIFEENGKMVEFKSHFSLKR
nr:T9SS type B sorting domain-containing protein [uncultured Flavobacterium sp.]